MTRAARVRLALDLLAESTHLLSERPQEKHQPELPVLSFSVDGPLSLPQRQVITFLFCSITLSSELYGT